MVARNFWTQDPEKARDRSRILEKDPEYSHQDPELGPEFFP